MNTDMFTVTEHTINYAEGKSVTLFPWSNGEGATISVYHSEKEVLAFSGNWETLNALSAGIALSQTT